MTRLHEIHLTIDERVRSIRENHPDWLCSKGCDKCCRQLADIPRLTAGEWDLLKHGLATLPGERFEAVASAIDGLAKQSTRPVVCPILDHASGACPVYAQRPVACRSYGFYAQRDKGMYCEDIKVRVDAGDLADVVWGNHDAIDRALADIGEMRSLTEWFSADALMKARRR